jgi:hypothetical protein
MVSTGGRFRRRHVPEQHGKAEEDGRTEEAHALRDFDAELARTAGQAQVLKERMAEALTIWLDATAPWAIDFWHRSLTESVQEEADKVVALSEGARSAAKQDAAELIANARSHIERRLVLDRSEDWPHLKPQTDPHDHAFRREGAKGLFDVLDTGGRGVGESAPEVVAGRLNGVLGDIASISARHGFELKGFGHGDPFGHKGRWHASREYAPAWSPQMVEAMSTYAMLHERYVAALVEAERISAEKRRSQANELWETA